MRDFFSKRDQIRRKLQIWSHLLKKPLMGNFFFFAVYFKIKHRRRAMGQVWSKLTNNDAKKKTQKYWSKDVLKNGCFGCFQKSF